MSFSFKHFAIPVLPILFCISCDLVKETGTETFVIENNFEILSVETINGFITIRTTDDSGNDNGIQVSVEKSAWGYNETDASNNLAKITVTNELDGDTHSIIIDVPPNINAGASLILDNVKDKQLNLKTANGKIDCDDMMGGTIETTNASVYVQKASNKINITSSNGGIKVEEFYGNLFTINTTNGDLDMKVLGAEEVNGSLDTSNGNIALDLSKDLSCVVELFTSNGDIDIDDIEPEIFQIGDNLFLGISTLRIGFTLNEGGGIIDAVTENASIDVNIFDSSL